jgi:hypothetical protein
MNLLEGKAAYEQAPLAEKNTWIRKREERIVYNA